MNTAFSVNCLEYGSEPLQTDKVGDMDARLVAPRPPPALPIPESSSTVDVRVIDTYVPSRHFCQAPPTMMREGFVVTNHVVVTP